MNKTHWLSLSESRHPYEIIPSARAKYVRVKLSSSGELSVVLPRGVAVKHAHEFLKSRTKWVEKHLKNIKLEKVQKRPECLKFKLLDENWWINYRHCNDNEILLTESGEKQLQISGNISELPLIQRIIQEWCKQKARHVFPIMLAQVAEEFGFHYNRLSIRAQKTRWGSCSSKKNINLNCKLLFMPPEIVRYVFIHELCHTLEMNHSSRFWALVEECDPFYNIHRKDLKVLSREIPL